MLVDCDTCSVRGVGCSDCVVTVLLGMPSVLELDDDEARAIDALAGSGLIPPLRLLPWGDAPEADGISAAG